MLESALGLIGDRPETLDLKIAAAALAEMREAFSVFGPYRDVPKVTVFGSARTATNDPLYSQATEIARLLAERGWMVVTGAGPGIMQAAMEGAGRERSIGVSIRLPFEQGANPVIAGDEKYVSMKYFFTRKLILVKESRAFVCLPGGFGTLDETFELLTLTQTGKGLPVPIIFLDTEGDSFWGSVDQLIRAELVTRNLVSAADTHLYFVTDSCDEACREIERFYANYDSIRYVGNQAIIRLRSTPTDEQLATLNESVRSPRFVRADRAHRTAGRRGAPGRPPRPAAHPLSVRQAQVRRPAGDDRRPQLVRCVPRPRRPRVAARSLALTRSHRFRSFAATPAGCRLLDGTARLGQRLVLGGSDRLAVGDCPVEHVEGGVVELTGDVSQARREVGVTAHGSAPIASATRSIGWRASTPAAPRCIAHPGFADATIVAPLRRRARSIAASLRSRIAAASSGCSAE